MNTPAARVIERAIAETAPEMRGSYLGGVTLGPRESSLAEASLRALVENETHPEIRAALQHVAEEFSRASSHHQIVTIVNADPAVSTSEVREIERDEEVHRAVIEAVGGTFSLQFVARLVEDCDFAAALRRLQRIRPDMTTPLQEVNELAALLMQGNWETIGLTDNQAGSLWYSFVRLMIEHHGERAKAILRHGHPVHAKQVARRIREEMGEAVPPPHGTKH